MADYKKIVSWIARSNSTNIDSLIERFVNILNVKSIKDFNKACKESKINNIFLNLSK